MAVLLSASLKEVEKKTWLTEDDVSTQVQSEISRSETFVTNIREEFKKEMKLFKNQKKNKDKIGDTTLFNVHCALMARSYVDRPQSKFTSTKIGRDYVIKNLNATYEEDFGEEDIEILKYKRDWDKYFYWVGIVCKTGWDWLSKTSTFETVNPWKWLPDPDWDYVSNNYSYSWYEKMMYKSDLLKNYTDEQIDELIPVWVDEQKQEEQVWDWFNVQTNSAWANPLYKITVQFTTLVWPKGTIKVMIEVWNNDDYILSLKILTPIKKEEKHADVPFPFAFTYWKPIEFNPFGQRVGTFVSDVQRTKSEMANLRLKKSKAELYPMYMYNTRLIKNKEDLVFWFNKLVATNPLEWESLNNAVAPIQRDFRADNSYMIDDSLDKQVESSTSIGKIVQWATPERREAATTNALQQDNTDINLALAAKIESWGEKQLLKLWLRGYLEKFTDWDRKIVNINTWFGIFPQELRKKDFLSEENVRIQVITVAELDKRRDKERLAYANTLPLLQTIQRPIAAQNYSYRRYLTSSGIPEPQVEIEVPLTPQEIIAGENVAMLIWWILPKVKEDYDPLTHLISIKAAPQSYKTEIYRQSLLQLYRVQWWEQQQLTEVSESVQNNVAAQWMSWQMQESANMLQWQ